MRCSATFCDLLALRCDFAVSARARSTSFAKISIPTVVSRMRVLWRGLEHSIRVKTLVGAPNFYCEFGQDRLPAESHRRRLIGIEVTQLDCQWIVRNSRSKS